ncbi:MAG: hypothetical protein K9M98_08510 [Cephaloticoccus sp.]|nr:hypothetical protein [Cephaloticoccus sp.]MCF7760532.1 hypothetical protein [Cephaloticoccus sp.]
MPLLEIEIIGKPTVPQNGLARKLADAIAEVFDSKPAQTWVRLRYLPVENYAENETDKPLGAKAVFVSILKYELPAASVLKKEARQLSIAVGKICGRSPKHIHIIYAPEGRGRIAFGGNLVQ